MATFFVKVQAKGLREGKVRKLAEVFGDQGISVLDIKAEVLPRSRADRLAAAESLVQDAASEVESLKDELQDWYDNLPENFQQGEKGSALEENIDYLDTLQDELESADFGSIEFPGMY
jgi:hypothetical protein